MFSRFLMFSYCAVTPTESAHQDGHSGSIGQAICETVGFVPDVPGFRFKPAIALPVSQIAILLDFQTGRICRKLAVHNR